MFGEILDNLVTQTTHTERSSFFFIPQETRLQGKNAYEINISTSTVGSRQRIIITLSLEGKTISVRQILDKQTTDTDSQTDRYTGQTNNSHGLTDRYTGQINNRHGLTDRYAGQTNNRRGLTDRQTEK